MNNINEALAAFNSQTNEPENLQTLLAFLQENSSNVNQVIQAIGQTENPVVLLNRLAIACFDNQLHESVIPLLNSALSNDSLHADTLFNLASVLDAYGERNLAIRYLEQIQHKDEDVLEYLRTLHKSKIDTQGVESVDQDDVAFTGERLVINKAVKETHADVLAEHLLRYELACKYVKDKVVLDAACGAGYGSKMLGNADAKSVYGIDISPESVRSAIPLYADHNVSFGVGDVHALLFDDETFDVVVSFETIEHIPNGAAWFKESARVLKPGGLFIVSTPNRRVTNPGSYMEESPRNQYHQYEYNTSDFIGELLVQYDLVEFYGQTIIHDFNRPENLFLRIMNHLNVHYIPQQQTPNSSHQLVPLHQIKNAEPVYIVAIGKKK